MATKVREKSINLNKGMERIFVDIPQSDMMFFQLFAGKMGWQFKNKQNLWDEAMKNRPENIDLPVKTNGFFAEDKNTVSIL